MRFLLAACGMLVALGACATQIPAAPNLPDAIAISYHSIALSPANLKEDRVGQLIWRGGIEISSPDARFGGWSGLIVSADGTHMLSQSDEAHWLKANLVYDANGNLAGIDHAELADMLNMSGEPMIKKEGDAEGLAALSPKGPDGPVIVSFEGNDRVWRYDLSHNLHAKPRIVPMPAAIAHLLPNLGLEGLTMLHSSTILAVAEDTRDANNDMQAWLVHYPVGEESLQHGQLGVKAHPPYEISDAAMGPDGNLYLLERHYFGPLGGIVAAVRKIDRASIKPGARLEGDEIAQFTMRENIDNMEGLSLRRGADGKTLVYMISDDNYNHGIQRTVLLMFELAQ